jgi:hypothetical protein
LNTAGEVGCPPLLIKKMVVFSDYGVVHLALLRVLFQLLSGEEFMDYARHSTTRMWTVVGKCFKVFTYSPDPN